MEMEYNVSVKLYTLIANNIIDALNIVINQYHLKIM